MSRGEKDAINSEVAIKAGLWYIVSSILTGIIGVISTPIFSRMMTTDEYGIYSTFSSWYSLLLPFCTLNLTYSIGRAKLDFPQNLKKYIGSMQLLSALVTGIVMAVVMVMLSPISEYMELSPFLVIMLCVYLFFSPVISFCQNGTRYEYKYKQNIVIALYTTIIPIVFSLVLILLFPAINKADLRALGIVISTCILAIYLWYGTIRRKEVVYSKEYWKYGLQISLPLILHTVSLSILAQSDRIFIAKICGQSDVAIYSMAYNYGVMISVITNSISNSWLPWFHDNYFIGNCNVIKVNARKLVKGGCYIGLGCIALAPEAMHILGGSQYEAGAECVMPIVLGIVCQYIYTHYVNIELHYKKTKYVSLGTICAALLNLMLNALFIPYYGFEAAAYTTLVSYIMLMIGHFFITRWIMKIKLYDDQFMFLALGIMGIVAWILRKTYDHLVIRYLCICIGLASFVFAYRHDIQRFIVTKKNKK